jgi:SAM-dependent methyltransferase
LTGAITPAESPPSDDILDLLACPDCGGGLVPEPEGPAAGALRCACGARFPVAAGIPRLLARDLRERLGPLGDRIPALGEIRAADRSSDNVALANLTYHATEPEAYGDEPLASIGMFDLEGNAQRRIADVIARMAAAGPADVLVDVGCGPGNVLRHVAGRFRRPLGVDLCVPMLERAARDGHRVLAGDAYRLPLKDGIADAVTAFSFLHHLAEPDRFLAEAARVLKPGGFFYSDWDPNGATRERSRLFQGLRDGVIAVLDRTGLAAKPRYYSPEVRPVAELAEFGWHMGSPLEGRRLGAELGRRGLDDVRVVFHDDCPSLDAPRSKTLAKRVQRSLTLLLSGQIGLLLGGPEARAEYFLLLGRKAHRAAAAGASRSSTNVFHS